MVNCFKLKIGAGYILALSFCSPTIAQTRKAELYPEFKNYSSWGLYFSPVVYRKATTTRYYGDYELTNRNSFKMGFGFEKLIHPERKWAYKVGFHFASTPLWNMEYGIKGKDIYASYQPFLENREYKSMPANSAGVVNRYVITIPLLVQFKKQMTANLYFNLETGFHVALMQKGEFSSSASYSNDDNTESREMFAMYAENPNTTVYPNIIISPGFYYTFHGFLLQANFIYQNSIPNYYKGEYQFGNLLESGPTRGSYKLSGDFIGLAFAVHLKKNKRRLSKQEEEINED